MNRIITNVTLTPYTENAENHSVMTIKGDDKLEADVLGLRAYFDRAFDAYIVKVVSDKEAVLSWRPESYENYVDTAAQIIAWPDRREYEIDFDKIKTVKDVKAILKGFNLRFFGQLDENLMPYLREAKPQPQQIVCPPIDGEGK